MLAPRWIKGRRKTVFGVSFAVATTENIRLNLSDRGLVLLSSTAKTAIPARRVPSGRVEASLLAAVNHPIKHSSRYRLSFTRPAIMAAIPGIALLLKVEFL